MAFIIHFFPKYVLFSKYLLHATYVQDRAIDISNNTNMSKVQFSHSESTSVYAGLIFI